jgi:predicted esterase YcpF (UPF0227 family)
MDPHKVHFTATAADANPDHNLHAVMSKAAYGDELAHHALKTNGWEVVPEMSSKKYTTFTKHGKAITAFRGTVKTDVTDLWTDVHLALGKEENLHYYRKAKNVAQKVVAKYGKDNVEFTGHSLGGHGAMYASDITGSKAIAFNPGVGLGNITEAAKAAFMNGVFRQPIINNTHIYRTQNDPVSFFANLTHAKVTVVAQKEGSGAHDLTNFFEYSKMMPSADDAAVAPESFKVASPKMAKATKTTKVAKPKPGQLTTAPAAATPAAPPKKTRAKKTKKQSLQAASV